MYKAYINWKPRGSALSTIDNANDIIKEYDSQGYILTLRQLYYQFVSRDLISNTKESYNNLGIIITKARMAGLLSWYAIEDRGRSLNNYYFEEDSQSIIDRNADYIEFDRWDRQNNYLEVWVEKEALGNVIERACDPYRVPHLSCKGYLSASEAWRAGRRIKEKLKDNKNCIIIHLGDHDPSGIDMSRDNQERLSLFSESFNEVYLKRIALNMNQVLNYNPPPNPTKLTDTRATDYINKYGDTCWELDALNPKIIEELITKEIKQCIDFDLWKEVEEIESQEKEILQKLAHNWDDIKTILDEQF